MRFTPGWTFVRATAVASALACGQAAVPSDRQPPGAQRTDTLDNRDQRFGAPLEPVPPSLSAPSSPSRFLGARVALGPVEVDPPEAGPNAAVISQWVRGREPQLRFCYQEYGLKHAPTLAGDVKLVAVLSRSGTVDTAAVAPGSTWLQDPERRAVEVESCLVQRVRGWRFPNASEPRLLRFSLEMHPPPADGGTP